MIFWTCFQLARLWTVQAQSVSAERVGRLPSCLLSFIIEAARDGQIQVGLEEAGGTSIICDSRVFVEYRRGCGSDNKGYKKGFLLSKAFHYIHRTMDLPYPSQKDEQLNGQLSSARKPSLILRDSLANIPPSPPLSPALKRRVVSLLKDDLAFELMDVMDR